MACEHTFDSLLEQLASQYRADIQVAVRTLSLENHDLRGQLAMLQAQPTAQSKNGLDIPTRRPGDDDDSRSTGDTERNGPRANMVIPWAVLPDAATAALRSRVSAGVAQSARHVTPAETIFGRMVSVPDSLMRSTGSCADSCATVSDAERFRHDSKGSRGSRDAMEKKIGQLSKKESTKMLRRLQRMLCPDNRRGDVRSEPLCPTQVLRALEKKGAGGFNAHYVTQLLQDLEEAAANLFSNERLQFSGYDRASHAKRNRQCICLEDLVSMFMMPDPDETLGEELATRLDELQSILVADDLSETIERLSSMADIELEQAGNLPLVERLREANMQADEAQKRPPLCGKGLDILVVFCVLTSIVLIGVSLDNDPDNPIWWLAECCCAAVFIVEVVVNLYDNGWRRYFVGADYGFNWLDLVVTTITVADVLFQALLDTRDASRLGMAMVLKSLRLFRFVRLVKLFNQSPMLKNLASMMLSFVVGAPTLIWVTIFIVMFIYVLAICFRTFFSVENTYYDMTPTELIQKCGHGDFVELDMHGAPMDPDCMLHVIYGYEYFGTVPRSMITVFRLMIGDTDTTGGKSLVQLLDTTRATGDSGTYSIHLPFFLFYIPFMIIVIFGMFNIITSIFVESTLNGLKTSELQIRRKNYYESHYVQEKLEELVRHIRDLMSDNDCIASLGAADLEIDKPTFHELMKNQDVKAMLADLDIVMDETLCHFDMFDLEGIGQISLTHLLHTLMRLRGETQKIDIVSSWSTLRAMQSRFQEFETVVLAMLQDLAIQQGSTVRHLKDVSSSVRNTPRHMTETDFLGQFELKLSV